MVASVSGSNLLSYYQGQTALGLLSSTSAGSSSATSSATNSTTNAALLSLLISREGIAGSAASSSVNVRPPTAPWSPTVAPPNVQQTVQNAISGSLFVDPSAAKLDAPAGVNASDYRNLFALYQGLNALNDIAQTAANGVSGPGAPTAAQMQNAFNSGLNQIQNFLSNTPFDAFNLTSGKVSTSAQSSVGIPNGAVQNYTTGIIGTGQQELPLKALQGDVKFTISIASINPRPRTSPIALWRCCRSFRRARSAPPTLRAFSCVRSSRITCSTARPAAQLVGLAP